MTRQSAWLLGAASMLLVAGGCPRATEPVTRPPPLPASRGARVEARVQRVESPRQLLRGPLAAGRPGDFRLDNGRLVLIVEGLDGENPGAIVDAAPASTAQDCLRRVSTACGAERQLPPRYARVEQEALGGAATLRFVGTDARNAAVAVVTEYALQPQSATLRILTTVTNHGRETLPRYAVGDLLDWGVAEPFAPGLGREPRGRPAVPWLGATCRGVAYAYFQRAGTVAVDLTGRVPTTTLQSLDVPPGGQVTVTRHLTLAPGGSVASLLPAIHRTRGTVAGVVEVTVTSDDGEPLAGAAVEVRQASRLVALTLTAADGAATLELPVGRYELRATTRDRIGPAVHVEVARERRAAVGLDAGPPSRLVFDVREEGKTSDLPARLTLLGEQGTPTPWLGPGFARRGRNVALSLLGRGVLPLPPGRYRVLVSHGPEYTIHDERITAQPFGGASVVARLRRVVDSSGHVALDAGQSTLATPGCAVRLADRLLSCFVEGVGATVIADRDAVRSWRRGTSRDVLILAGLTSTSQRLGAFTVYPFSENDADWPEGFQLPRLASSPRVVQLDSARQPGIGLLARAGFDPAGSAAAVPAVTALRLLDGEHPEDFERLLEDWLALLRAGRRIVATAASAASDLAEGPAGFPRTWVQLARGGGVPELVAALRAGRAVISSGPFLRLTINGAGPGSTVTRPGNTVAVRVVVAAPAWIPVDDVTLYLGGRPWGKPLAATARGDGVRLDQTVRVPLTRDTFVVAVVRGVGSLRPVGPPTLPVVAVSNPVWIDHDGDGKLASPSPPAP